MALEQQAIARMNGVGWKVDRRDGMPLIITVRGSSTTTRALLSTAFPRPSEGFGRIRINNSVGRFERRIRGLYLISRVSPIRAYHVYTTALRSIEYLLETIDNGQLQIKKIGLASRKETTHLQ